MDLYLCLDRSATFSIPPRLERALSNDWGPFEYSHASGAKEIIPILGLGSCFGRAPFSLAGVCPETSADTAGNADSADMPTAHPLANTPSRSHATVQPFG